MIHPPRTGNMFRKMPYDIIIASIVHIMEGLTRTPLSDRPRTRTETWETTNHTASGMHKTMSGLS